MVDLTKDIDLDKLSEGELIELWDKMKNEDEKPAEPPKPPEKVSVTLSDGSVLEAANHEELNRLLLAKLTEYRQAEEPTPQEPEKVEFNFKTFEEKFLKDPREAQEYMEITQYGMPVTKMVPFLIAGLAQTARRLQELEAYRFVSETEGYKASPQNRAVIEQIMRERGWQPSYQTLQDAYLIAKGRGLIDEKPPETKPTTPYTPPRVGGAGSEPSADSVRELRERAYEASLEELENFLIKAGALSRGQ